MQRPAWHALLAPLPVDATPRRCSLASSGAAASGEAAAIAGWESLVLDLSAGEAGLRVVNVLLDAEGRLLSASDHVLLRHPDGRPPRMRQESIGGRFEADGSFRGTCWLVEGPEPPDDQPPDWAMTPRQPTDAEAAALRTLAAEVLRRASPAGLDADVAAYYERAPEERRLAEGPAQLEFVRTRELVRRFAPPPPAVALDVGGGTGPYALWLASLGYEVHLLDAVPRLVGEARRASAGAAAPLASCAVGDARRLDRPDASVDHVLLLGPLYHLPDPRDRDRALREAYRVLRPGGVVFAAAISRFASALDGLSRDLLGDPAFNAIVEQDLASGRHRNPTSRLDYFTTAYFHHPQELERELRDAGFVIVGLYGLEGTAWLLQDFDRRWADPGAREALLHTVRALESEPTLIGVSAHLLAVGRRPLPSDSAGP